ncbi:MAG: Hsp70 family protein [Myxococcota bacterium]|nr:Hsp70 family protein [Myxococcota bacterium]
MARFVVGIDLGTSNSCVAFADLKTPNSSDRPRIEIFEIPQLIGPGDVQPRTLLPSMLYMPSKVELNEQQLRLPWQDSPTEDVAQKALEPVVGYGARKLGAKTSIRLVESSKSWLCHGGVNRNANILPWHAPDSVRKISPVDAATRILLHITRAWNHEMANDDVTLRLQEQDVVITVPASFDEIARRLTLEAAKKANLQNVTLIEEPMAAFYSFVDRTGGTTSTTGLSGGEQILIADVGGGTSDFTLIQVTAPKGDDGLLGFERTAVGDHLLLGGDNMDLALAHAIEPELTQGKKRLDAEAWAQLKLECKLAKEALFTDLTRDEIPVVLAGKGRKLVGGAMRAVMHRDLLQKTILDGYYPPLQPGVDAEPTPTKRAGFAEYGLPFAHEPAITKHLAGFLIKHAEPSASFARVDAILYNGGTLKPVTVRERIQTTLGDWFRSSGQPEAQDPKALVYDQGTESLEFAVSKGAAYFGLVRQGRGIRIGGGSPREFFVGLDDEIGSKETDQIKVLCVAPKGMQDGQQLEVSDREFQLVTNRPVSFPLFSSNAPTKNTVGEVLTVDRNTLESLPPLQTVVKFGKQKAGTTIPVRIQAKRTELGTLELSCFSRMSGARFQLEFDLRSSTTEEKSANSNKPSPSVPFEGAGTRAPPEEGDFAGDALERGIAYINEVYAVAPPRPDPDSIMKNLEKELGLKRDKWPLAALRPMGEHLIEISERRKISPELEARWLNLAGFCLRPGDGYPLDDWRVRQLWKVHGDGLNFPSKDPSELNWWILWRRVACGLSRGHQQELSSELFPMLIPNLAKRAKRRPPKSDSQMAVEMWRAAASLERIGAKSRAQLGSALVELISRKKTPRSGLWCLGRIGARRLLYGPREATVKPSTVTNWIEKLLSLPKLSRHEAPKDCLISLGRMTGDRQFDLEESVRLEIMAYLVQKGVAQDELKPLREVIQVDRNDAAAAFGEALPSGLRLD